MKYCRLNTLENMMSNIIAEGKYETWQSLELEKDAFKRIKLRRLYKQAIIKLSRGK